MSKAHKTILHSLRQKPPRQPRGVQTKGIQSFEVHEDLCWDDSLPSPLCGAGTASQLCYLKQTAAEQTLEGPAFIYTLLRPSAGKPLCEGHKGPGKLLRSSPGDTKPAQAPSAGLGGPCHRGITHSQPRWFEMRTDVWLLAPGSDPSLISNTDKPLQIYGPTLTHLMILLISAGVAGQAKFEALPFCISAFQIQFFLWLVPPQAPSLWCRLPTALLREPTSIFESRLPRREVCLRLISTSFGIG